MFVDAIGAGRFYCVMNTAGIYRLNTRTGNVCAVVRPDDRDEGCARFGRVLKEGAMSDRVVGYALCLTGLGLACGLVWLVSWLL